MKNKYRNSEYDRNRDYDNDRSRRSGSRYDDDFNSYNESGYYSNANDSNFERNNDRYPNYNYPQSNVNNYTGYDSNSQTRNRGDYGYNSPQPYRGNSDNAYQSYRSRDWQSNDRGDRNNRNNWNDQYTGDDRGWWDRTRDEVSSWFGDEDAERRRRMDEMREENHRGKGPKNYTRSVDRIKEDVNDKLSDNWFLDASWIEVEVKGNEVTLSGTVNSKSDKRRAEDIADNISGVSHVQNNLRVNKTTDNNTSKEPTAYTTRTRKEVLNHN